MSIVFEVLEELSEVVSPSEFEDVVDSDVVVVVTPSSSVTETSVVVVDSELIEQPRVPSASTHARPVDRMTLRDIDIFSSLMRETSLPRSCAPDPRLTRRTP